MHGGPTAFAPDLQAFVSDLVAVTWARNPGSAVRAVKIELAQALSVTVCRWRTALQSSGGRRDLGRCWPVMKPKGKFQRRPGVYAVASGRRSLAGTCRARKQGG